MTVTKRPRPARRTAQTADPRAPMLFAFRGVRVFQVVLSLVALASGIGVVLVALEVSRGNGAILLIPGVILMFVFSWAFMGALRAPTSFVAITDERTRIRFAGFVDTVIPTSNIAGAQLVQWSLLRGIGIRTNFGGRAALVTAPGTAVQITLAAPIRVSVIPGLLRVEANRLTLSVKNPRRMVERFGARA